MGFYRKRPIVIEAYQFSDDSEESLIFFDEGVTRYIDNDFDFSISAEIDTLEGTMTISGDDWLIKGVNGEYYPIKNDIFLKSYEEVTTDSPKQSTDPQPDVTACGFGDPSVICDNCTCWKNSNE